MKNRHIDAIEWLLIALLCLTLAVTAGINFHAARHVLDDDASSELMLAHLLYREKALYSEDFYYSTEFFVQNQLIFGFLFNFFDGWANVRFVGTCLIQLIYLASFVFMMSQSRLGRKAVLFSAVLIMLPFTVVYGRTILYHCYYVWNFIPTYLLAGLLFTFSGDRKTSRSSRTIRLVFIIMISFVSCLLYIRQVFLTMIPFAGCLFFFLLSHSEKEKTPWQKWMLLPLMMLIAGGAGMIVNSRLLIPALNLYEQTEQNLNVLSPAAWGPILAAFFTQFGFRTGVRMFSLVGILSLGGLFSACILIFSTTADLAHSTGKNFRYYLMRTMLPVSLLINLAIFIFGDIPFRLQADYSRYLVPASVWIVPVLCTFLQSEEKLPHIRKIVYILCTVIFIANGIFNGASFLNSKNFGQPYDGISYDNPHLADDLQSAIEFIRAHDYEYGYAFAGTANTLMELMNGFPVVSIRQTPDSVFEHTNWLTIKSIKELPAENAFFLMTEKEAELYQQTLAETGLERIYFDDEGYVLYDVPDVPAFREHIREPE